MSGDGQKQTGRARTLTCPRCGGTVPLVRYHPSVDCPFCNHRWEIPTPQLVQLSRHNARVRGLQVRAEDALERAAASARGANGGFALAAVSAGCILLAIGAATWVIQRLGLAPNIAAALTALVASCLFYAGAIASSKLLDRRRRSEHAVQSAPLRVRCASCGGRQECAPGEVFERCRFCGSALLPGNTIMVQAEASAAHAAQHAELFQRRAQQRLVIAERSRDATALRSVGLGFFFVPVVLWAGGALPSLWPKLAAFFPALLLSSLLIARRRRARFWERRLAGIVSQLGATRLRDLAAVCDWWDAHWMGSVLDAELGRGPCWLAYAANLEGRPLLLVLNAVGESERFPALLIGRVAAWSPASWDPSGSAEYAAAARRLEAQGLDLRTESAGFWFRASAATLESWQPGRTDEAIGTAFVELCRATRERCAAPGAVQ